MSALRAAALLFFSVVPWSISGLPAMPLPKNIFHPPTSFQEPFAGNCPDSCREIFPSLTCTGNCDGGMEHSVEVQERGGGC